MALGVIIGIFVAIAIAGYIKFGLLADDIYVTDQNGEVVNYNELQKKIEAGQHPAEWPVE